jgi:tRNA dimethylallyltransferase
MQDNGCVKPLLVIVGPTASGKSALAVQVGTALRRLGQPAEIVNADSMLVYRGMDIGSAKPSPDELAAVRHHVVDVLGVSQTATVADFQRLARTAIEDCRAREVVPILVGGSALHVRAIVDDFEFPGTDPVVRDRWQAELDRIGPEALHEVLRRKDAASADQILPGNGRRIVRALEVIELTGAFRATLPEWRYLLPEVRQFGIGLDRDEIDRRIADRVEDMWARGFVDEVRILERQGLREGLTASRGLGYRQILSYLADECTEEEAKQATIFGTRRFARKQMGWWRRDPRITWLEPVPQVQQVEYIVNVCLARGSGRTGQPCDS